MLRGLGAQQTPPAEAQWSSPGGHGGTHTPSRHSCPSGQHPLPQHCVPAGQQKNVSVAGAKQLV